MDKKYDTTVEAWTVGRLVSASKNADGDGSRVIVPRFQRSVVWGEDQRRLLIESIFSGFPVGSILLHDLGKRADKSGSDYLLVDGLQRTTTLAAYMDLPLRYAPVEEVLPNELVEELRAKLQHLTGGSDVSYADVLASLEDWMRETGSTRLDRGFTPSYLGGHLIRRFGKKNGDPLDAAELEELGGQCLQAMQDAVDLSSAQIPAIVYSGLESNLPGIFELLNSKGTQLSKYEIYAATWVSDEVVIGNPALREIIEAKYQDLRDRGLEIEGLDNGDISTFTLFEYLFALGKHLADLFPLLYAGSKDPSETSPIAFSIATIAHGLRISDMAKLPAVVDRDNQNRIDLSAFEAALIASSKLVEDSLAPNIGLKLNQRSGTQFRAHTDYQIGSMVVRMMTAVYNEQWTLRDDPKAKETLVGTLPAHYLHDILQKSWRGPSDQRFFEMAWDLEEGDAPYAERIRPGARYLRGISENQWAAVFNVWFDSQLQKEQRSRPNILSAEKIFLKYVYSGIVTVHEEFSNDFDIEHLFPVSRLKELIADDEPGWPISCVGNLALFTEELNREKLKLTISEFLEHKPEKLESVQKYLLCDADLISIPKDEQGNTDFDRSSYEEVLRARFSEMTQILIGRFAS